MCSLRYCWVFGSALYPSENSHLNVGIGKVVGLVERGKMPDIRPNDYGSLPLAFWISKPLKCIAAKIQMVSPRGNNWDCQKPVQLPPLPLEANFQNTATWPEREMQCFSSTHSNAWLFSHWEHLGLKVHHSSSKVSQPDVFWSSPPSPSLGSSSPTSSSTSPPSPSPDDHKNLRLFSSTIDFLLSNSSSACLHVTVHRTKRRKLLAHLHKNQQLNRFSWCCLFLRWSM